MPTTEATKIIPATPHVSRPTDRIHDANKNHLSVTVGVVPEVAYTFFRDLQNLPLFMKDLKSVEILSETRSRWTVEVKGRSARWEAEITADQPGKVISWESIEGAEVKTSGSIWFSRAPETLGTRIDLEIDYSVPGGKLTELFTMMSGEDPKSLTLINLRRLKCFLETGEVATIEGQTSGRDEGAKTIYKH